MPRVRKSVIKPSVAKARPKKHRHTEHKSKLVAAGIRAQTVLPGWLSSPAWVTRLSKRDADRVDPALVAKFAREFGIDYGRATLCRPSDSLHACAARYGSLNAFFQRRERGISVAADAWLSSPSTGMAVLFRSFPAAGVWVKGRRWSLGRLVPLANNNANAAGNNGGPTRVMIVRLRPSDYHRFHAPFSGQITAVRDIKGGYLSVDPLVVRSKDVLTENHRVVYEVAVDALGGARAFVVAVGAAIIGQVISSLKVGDRIERGQDMGTFGFGGSTVVVVWPGGGVLREDLLTASAGKRETYVTVGESVGPTGANAVAEMLTQVANRRRAHLLTPPATSFQS
jgi:phosphatidylserine decarboxylase